MDQQGSNDQIMQMFASIIIPEELQQEWLNNNENGIKNNGVPQDFIDSLPRLRGKDINLNDQCPICYETYGDDEYPLVAELPHCHHRFDLQCISLWLSKQSTCPLCRDIVNEKKLDESIDVSKAELEEDWGMYG